LSPRNDEEEATPRTTDNDETCISSSTCTQAAQRHSTKLFLFGMLIGLARYCLLASHCIPTFSLGFLSDIMAKALLWPTFTAAIASFTYWALWECLMAPLQMQTEEFVERCEYYNALGVFWGFGVARTIDCILVHVLFGTAVGH
jgi:hypothetical protein